LDEGVAWQVIVPVKSLTNAKTRLVAQSGSQREDLALAFAMDAIGAALTCASVETVLVTTGDPLVQDALRSLGVTFSQDTGAGLNASIVEAAAALPAGNVAALVADLPCLDSRELDVALARAEKFARSFVCDAAGIGTTLLMATRGHALHPRFGSRSRAAHAASGAVEITDPLQRLRRDVDTAVDFWDAQRIGVGPATQAALGARPHPE
jgi:2-phospho-L-lactate guanylyltransferase